MTDAEMIEAYLSKDSPTACPEEIRISNEQSRVSNKCGASLLDGVNSRMVEKANCELCTREFSVIKKKSETPKNAKGWIGKKWTGDKYCETCRVKLLNEEHKKLKHRLDKLRAERKYGDYKNMMEDLSSYIKTPTKNLNKKQLIETVSILSYLNSDKIIHMRKLGICSRRLMFLEAEANFDF